MYNKVKREDIDVVVLCGGLGERLRPISGRRPKPMVEIGGRPFLDILIDYVSSFGFRRFILCIGHMGDVIKQYYKRKGGLAEIIFSEERESLGTAGAIRNAEAHIRSSPFLVMNGDSFCQLDFAGFLDFHLERAACCSIVLTDTVDGDAYGAVSLRESERVGNFSKKAGDCSNVFVSAGIYLFQKEILPLIPVDKKFSLEENLFPMIVDREFYGYLTKERFIDIGTPERYKEAERLLSKY